LSILERTILESLVYNEEYVKAVSPFLKEEYFEDPAEKLTYTLIDTFIQKYKAQPTPEALVVGLEKSSSIDGDVYKNALEVISDLDNNTKNIDWLMDETEKFCQERGMYNAIKDAVSLFSDNKEEKFDMGSIPEKMKEALKISFDNSIGHDWLEDAEERYEYYHKKEEKVPIDLDIFNKILRGGMKRKTLNVIMAGTSVGKSLMMCHMAAVHMIMGYKVLYITAEMSEKEISLRIDANRFNMTEEEITLLPKQDYLNKVEDFKKKTAGRLIIREFATATSSAAHFHHLIDDLVLKQNFFPDIIYVDYINLCTSTRYKSGANINSYNYIKAVAEELRGLSMELDVVMVTATQTNRDGYDSSDPGITDTAESWALPQTADFMIAMIADEKMKKLGQILIKQLKNRNNDENYYRRFIIGVDKSKYKLYDVEQNAQDVMDADKSQPDLPAFDNTTIGQRFDKEKLNKLNV
jgi:replicative DNA helicase